MQTKRCEGRRQPAALLEGCCCPAKQQTQADVSFRRRNSKLQGNGQRIANNYESVRQFVKAKHKKALLCDSKSLAFPSKLLYMNLLQTIVWQTIVLAILLQASIHQVACAQLEAQQIKLLINDDELLAEKARQLLADDDEDARDFASSEQEGPYHLYRSQLKRLSYETIHRILRDENEPISRRPDPSNDVHFAYRKAAFETGHDINKRSLESAQNNDAVEQSRTAVDNNKNKELLDLSNRNLSHFNLNNTQFNQSLAVITTIDLSHNQLNAIDLMQFPQHLEVLNLTANRFEMPPISANSTVKTLILNENLIKNFTAPANRKLLNLHLSSNQIDNLLALNLSLLSNLQILDLSCNRIANLETTFFPQLMHKLKFLNLANNRLTSISRETFFNLLSLNTLILSGNQITVIDYETFLSLPNLQYLELSFNQLHGESIRALQGIPDLVSLSIAYNPDMGDSLQEFVASWSLKEVDASGTGLCQIPAALAQAVRTLKLADNWFKIINCGDLDSYPLLQHLDLSVSHIEDIEEDALGRLELLEVLFLDHNQLRRVPNSLPTSLEHLFLQNNQIMDIQTQAFQGLKHLKTLHLSHNKLLYLPALSLPKLITLNLQASGLQSLNQAIVHTLPHLRDLLLEDNPIKCSELLGIAEWASPCRISERSAFTANKVNRNNGQRNNDNDDNGNGLVSMQLLDEDSLKHMYLQMHNFYEKFNCKCRGMRNEHDEGFATQPTQMPPACAVEAEDERTTIVTTMMSVVMPLDNFIGLRKTKRQDTRPSKQHEWTVEATKQTENEGRAATKLSIFNQQNFTNEDTNMATKPPLSLIENGQQQHSNVTESKVNAKAANATENRDVTLHSADSATPNTNAKQPENEIQENSTKIVMTTKPPETTASDLDARQLQSTVKSANTESKSEIAITISPQQQQQQQQQQQAIYDAGKTPAKHGDDAVMPKDKNEQDQQSTTPITATTATTTTTATTGSLEALIKTTAMAMAVARATKQPTVNRNYGSNDKQQRQTKEKVLLTASLAGNERRNTNFKRSNPSNGQRVTTTTITTTTEATLVNGDGEHLPATTLATTLATPTAATHKHMELHLKDRHLIGTPLLMHNGDEHVLVEAREHLQFQEKHETTTTTLTPAKATSPASAATPAIQGGSAISLNKSHDAEVEGVKETSAKTAEDEKNLAQSQNMDIIKETLQLKLSQVDETTTTTTTTTTSATATIPATKSTNLSRKNVADKQQLSIKANPKANANNNNNNSSNNNKEAIKAKLNATNINVSHKSKEAILHREKGKLPTTPMPLKETAAMRKHSAKKAHSEEIKKKPTGSLIMKKMTITTSRHGNQKEQPEHPTTTEAHLLPSPQHHQHFSLNTPRENEATRPSFDSKFYPPLKSFNVNDEQPHYNAAELGFDAAHTHHSHVSVNNEKLKSGLPTFHDALDYNLQAKALQSHAFDHPAEAAAALAAAKTAIANSLQHPDDVTHEKLTKTHSAQLAGSKQQPGDAVIILNAHPGFVILISLGLLGLLLVGLMHVYRCELLPWQNPRHRQQRPYRSQTQHPQQQHFAFDGLNDSGGGDAAPSFLNYQSSAHHQQCNFTKWQHSPLHHLQVRELQQTSAVEAQQLQQSNKQFFKQQGTLTSKANTNGNGNGNGNGNCNSNSSSGERSQASSLSSSSRSSTMFDDETLYIEMVPDSGQTTSMHQSDILPMELLNLSKYTELSKTNFGASRSRSDDFIEIESSNLHDVELSTMRQQLPLVEDTGSESKASLPTSRKFGIW